MRSRRKAREAALQALYQCDTLQDWSAESIAIYFAVYQKDPHAAESDAAHAAGKPAAAPSNGEQENIQFAHALIEGVCENMEFVDKKISEASLHWSINRMSRVDRNILRLCCFEMAFLPNVPMNVSLNEAIELAKAYGADESPMFVNGVLDRIAKSLAGISDSLLSNIIKAKKQAA